MTADSSSKISKDFIEEEKKEILASVEEEEKETSASDEEGLTKAGEKAAAVNTLPANAFVRGYLIIPGAERFMLNNSRIEISGAGAVIRDPDTWGIKIRHPNNGGKARIEITAESGEGDPDRLTVQYGQSFDKIARMIVPYLSSDLIVDVSPPADRGWQGIFGITPEDDDGIHMFSPSIAAYYNARRTYTLVWDIANPVLNSRINTHPDPQKNNFAFKATVATLDPTDPTLPAYDASTAPCGVDAEGVYHIPFGIGCKAPTTIVDSKIYVPSVDIRGAGKVMLKGDNSYLVEGTVHVRKGVEAVITTPQSMPQSNISVQPDIDGGTSTLTFVANGTPFAMRNGTTLTVQDGGAVNVPHNARLNLGRANVAVEAGATMSIDGNVRF